MNHSSLQPRPRWVRFPLRLSLRVMMVLLLLIGVGLGWVVTGARNQREAVAAIERAGGKVFYDWQVKTSVTPDYEDLSINNPNARPPWPKWITDRVGIDLCSTAKLVIIPGPADPIMPQVGRLRQLEEIHFLPRRNNPDYGPTDVGMVHLRRLKQLKHLMLGGTSSTGAGGSKITGVGLAAISGATRLQILTIHGVSLADADLVALRGLTDLRILELEGPGITDAGLTHLAGLVELRKLSLPKTNVTAAGIVRLHGMTRLKTLTMSLSQVASLDTFRPLASLTVLTLARTPITDAGLASASDPGFAGLTSLNLAQTRISDQGLKSLQDLPRLKSLELVGTDVTDAGVAEFGKVRPTIKVNRVPRASPKRPPAPAPKK